jgi:hypothetical protein
MENKNPPKRGLIVFLVIASVAIFIGLVWLIATFLPFSPVGPSRPSFTPNITRIVTNCTYPVSFWVEHPELYPAQIVLGSKVFQANEIREALIYSNQNLPTILQAQLVGAFLNITAGADQSMLETTIFQAYRWLVLHPDGSQILENDIETGSRYFSVLEAYNLGLGGVPTCEEGYIIAIPETQTASITPSATMTIAISQTPTTTPSETATPTTPILTPFYTYVAHTRTPIPTTQPPVGQTPTKNPPPPASTPTFTQPPPPIATFTLPPLPSATHTLIPPPPFQPPP